ncbi:MAG: DUF4430 domain-containing protein [Clostridia bacterium]|nr:DUF4430 domain-containing protein [Clostridia bacterium]
MKKHKNKIIAALVIFVVLIFAFWQGGALKKSAEIAENPEKTVAKTEQIQENIVATDEKKDGFSDISAENDDNFGQKEAQITKQEEADNTPKEQENPAPADPQNTDVSSTELTCTFSIRCDTVLSNLALLDPAKADIIPPDGIFLAEKTVAFYEGESVFNLLLRETKQNRIHMEFKNTPVFNSVYIEGIGNLYEFDCGELSGWMYKVNGWFPNYGCSRYLLHQGDKVEWVYTCDLGADVGGDYSSRNGM